MTCVPASPVHIRSAPPGRSPRALRGGAPRLVYVVARRRIKEPGLGNDFLRRAAAYFAKGLA